MPMVLVVDDDAAIRVLISALLGRAGIESEFAVDGVEAIARLRTGRYDGIVLDLMMPGVSGFDVLQYLRCERRDMLPRTVVVTAAADRTLQYFSAADVHAVIRKPFDIEELLRAVWKSVDGHSNSDR